MIPRISSRWLAGRSVLPVAIVSMAVFAACSPAQPGSDGSSSGDAHGVQDAVVVCGSNADCDDGLYCNGPERCLPGDAHATANGCVPAESAIACGANRSCDERQDRCVTSCAHSDADGDGHIALDCPGGDDCDDGDANRYPGNTEVCDNNHDEDCNPSTVNRQDRLTGRNIDGDADGDRAVSTMCCNVTEGGGHLCGNDCNDAVANVSPFAVEVCDGVDNNCNGHVDEGLPTALYYSDCDGDQFGDGTSTPVTACATPTATPHCVSPTGTPGWSDVATDCDDADGARNPGRPELCNGIDDNCDGVIDESPAEGSCSLAPDAIIMACHTGTCSVATCRNGHADCDTVPSNGCEVDTNTSVTNCGACGAACVVAHGEPACQHGLCIARSCLVGFHPCGPVCGANDSPLTCGNRCDPCTPPSHGQPTCDGASCGFTCDTGFHRCGATCGDDTSPLTCGSLCAPCTPPDHAVGTCVTGRCDFACLPDYVRAGDHCVAGPRPIAPISGARITSRRPLLQWELPMNADSAHVEICADRDCHTIIVAFDAPGSSGRPPSDLPPGVLFWRLAPRTATVTSPLRSAVWAFSVPALGSVRDGLCGAFFDVNGDGYADLATTADRNAAGAGRIHVLLGSRAGLSSDVAGSASLAMTASSYGLSAAAVGDVNGDGFGDLAVGVQDSQRVQSDRVLVYYGGPAGIADGASPGATLTVPPGPAGSMDVSMGGNLRGVGDIDRDGYADFAVTGSIGLPLYEALLLVYRGGPGGFATGALPATTIVNADGEGPAFGDMAATPGDLNADGFTDIIVNSAGLSNSVWVYFGAAAGIDTSPARVLQVADSGALATGDFDADGYCDLVVGSSAARIYPGANVGLAQGGATFTQVQGIADAPLNAVVSAGDVDGDGYCDLVSLTASAGSGGAAVFRGGPAGILENAAPSVSLRPPGAYGHCTVQASNDFDNDGHADIVLGAPSAFFGWGELFLWVGASGGAVDPTTLIILGHDSRDSYFGERFARRSPTRAPHHQVRATRACRSQGV